MSIRGFKRTGLYENSWFVMFNEYLSTGKRYIYVKMCKNCGVFIYTKKHLYTASDIEFIENQPNLIIRRDLGSGYCPQCHSKIFNESIYFDVEPSSHIIPIG